MSDPGADQHLGGLTAAKGTPMPVDVSRDRRARRLWLEFLAGPLIWFAHFMLVYVVVEAGCQGSGAGLELFAPPVAGTVTLVATVVATVACLATAAWAHRRARGFTDADNISAQARELVDPGGPLAFAGLILSLLSAVAVLFVGLPVLWLGTC
ncbi:MAG: hypothetical protein KY434_11125 [Actinobacteria bacterium]|nr:hypothetical protein [Actinomycetota bacterium]